MKYLLSLACILLAFVGNAQQLSSFTVNLTTAEKGGHQYLSIQQKKAFSKEEALRNKSAIDLALVISKGWGKPALEWYNMSGKDGAVAAELTGTATVINGISFDQEQFAKCNSNKDLQKMAGHISSNAFSHFASVSSDVEKGIAYHCFIIQMENGKRALLWIDAVDADTYTVKVKVQP